MPRGDDRARRVFRSVADGVRIGARLSEANTPLGRSVIGGGLVAGLVTTLFIVPSRSYLPLVVTDSKAVEDDDDRIPGDSDEPDDLKIKRAHS